MNQSKTSGRLLKTAERRSVVLRLRKAGATYEEIAQALLDRFGPEKLPKGWDRRYAWMDVHRELEKLQDQISEDVEAVRRMELERLDAMQKALWGRAAGEDADYRAVDRVLKIMRRRADLMGLDAPQRREITGEGGGPIQVEGTRVIFGD